MWLSALNVAVYLCLCVAGSNPAHFQSVLVFLAGFTVTHLLCVRVGPLAHHVNPRTWRLAGTTKCRRAAAQSETPDFSDFLHDDLAVRLRPSDGGGTGRKGRSALQRRKGKRRRVQTLTPALTVKTMSVNIILNSII